jgi:hypothetical protein
MCYEADPEQKSQSGHKLDHPIVCWRGCAGTPRRLIAPKYGAIGNLHYDVPFIRLNEKPGLGIEINEDTLQELTVFQDVVR